MWTRHSLAAHVNRARLPCDTLWRPRRAIRWESTHGVRRTARAAAASPFCRVAVSRDFCYIVRLPCFALVQFHTCRLLSCAALDPLGGGASPRGDGKALFFNCCHHFAASPLSHISVALSGPPAAFLARSTHSACMTVRTARTHGTHARNSRARTRSNHVRTHARARTQARFSVPAFAYFCCAFRSACRVFGTQHALCLHDRPHRTNTWHARARKHSRAHALGCNHAWTHAHRHMHRCTWARITSQTDMCTRSCCTVTCTLTD